MRFIKKWVALVGILYLPLIYFLAAYIFATKVPNAANVVALAPYAAGLLLIAYLVKGQGRWLSARGVVALPLAGVGFAGLVAIFVALVAISG